MTEKKKQGFSTRSLISYILVFSFIAMALSGVILYIAPQGKVAHWTVWKIWGLDKEQWGAVHILNSLLFTIAGVYHIILNIKPLINYLKSKITRKFAFRIEVVLALLITLVFTFGTVFEIQPLQSVMNANENIKVYWEKSAESAPPIPHAEQMSVKELATKLDLNLDEVLKNLKDKGIKGASAEAIIQDIAAENSTTPSVLYNIIKPTETNTGSGDGDHTTETTITGIGKMSIGELCEKANIPLEKAITTLSAKGVTAEKDSKVRDISNELGIQPTDVLEIIQK